MGSRVAESFDSQMDLIEKQSNILWRKSFIPDPGHMITNPMSKVYHLSYQDSRTRHFLTHVLNTGCGDIEVMGIYLQR